MERGLYSYQVPEHITSTFFMLLRAILLFSHKTKSQIQLLLYHNKKEHADLNKNLGSGNVTILTVTEFAVRPSSDTKQTSQLNVSVVKLTAVTSCFKPPQLL